ncbi:putative phosphorylated CTD-interacting factor 1 [Paratrimastix pyriformis]|uniref:Phosphorylated CTD-interacting factor 1 n=1 Tax=Paratrimastix pyriformis TaxID=342808 RepID=A0ABQ8U7Q3_9EUKA|nr:putative phosphorylated CTD-interacting factor 1 [Paratrimastix pyriformis]
MSPATRDLSDLDIVQWDFTVEPAMQYTSNQYPLPPTRPDLEDARSELVSRLRLSYARHCNTYLQMAPPLESFNRWLFGQLSYPSVAPSPNSPEGAPLPPVDALLPHPDFDLVPLKRELLSHVPMRIRCEPCAACACACHAINETVAPPAAGPFRPGLPQSERPAMPKFIEVQTRAGESFTVYRKPDFARRPTAEEEQLPAELRCPQCRCLAYMKAHYRGKPVLARQTLKLYAEAACRYVALLKSSTAEPAFAAAINPDHLRAAEEALATASRYLQGQEPVANHPDMPYVMLQRALMPCDRLFQAAFQPRLGKLFEGFFAEAYDRLRGFQGRLQALGLTAGPAPGGPPSGECGPAKVLIHADPSQGFCRLCLLFPGALGPTSGVSISSRHYQKLFLLYKMHAGATATHPPIRSATLEKIVGDSGLNVRSKKGCRLASTSLFFPMGKPEKNRVVLRVMMGRGPGLIANNGKKWQNGSSKPGLPTAPFGKIPRVSNTAQNPGKPHFCQQPLSTPPLLPNVDKHDEQHCYRYNYNHHEPFLLLQDPELALFPGRLYSLVRRYATLMGPQPFEGAGFHAAASEAVFQALRRDFGVTAECFASPLNCYFPQFCSCFADTDAPFGSLGSFFDFCPATGSFEAGPPYTEESMDRMADRLEVLLGATAQPLSFVVFVPDWEDPPCRALLVMGKSRFLREHLAVSAAEHTYISGAQHLLETAPVAGQPFPPSIPRPDGPTDGPTDGLVPEAPEAPPAPEAPASASPTPGSEAPAGVIRLGHVLSKGPRASPLATAPPVAGSGAAVVSLSGVVGRGLPPPALALATKNAERVYRVPHGTRIFVLQNDAGLATWPPTPQKMAALRQAMGWRMPGRPRR